MKRQASVNPAGIGGVHDFEAVFFRDLAGLALGVKADDDLDPAVLQVECVCVALRAEPNHGAGFAFQHT